MKNRTAIALLSTVVLAAFGAWLLVMVVGQPYAADPLNKGTTAAEGVTQAFAGTITPLSASLVNWIYCFILLLLGYCAVLGLVIFPRNLKQRFAGFAEWRTVLDDSWSEVFGRRRRRGADVELDGEEADPQINPENPRAQVQQFADAVLDRFEEAGEQHQDFSTVVTNGLRRFNPDEGPDILYHAVASQKEDLHDSLDEELSPLEVGLHLSPLLGFLGTVISLVKLFYNVSISSTGMNQQAVAQDLQEALITTVFGLVSAFFIHLIRLFVQSQLRSYMDELSTASQRVVGLVQEAIEQSEEALSRLNQKSLKAEVN